MNNRDIEYVLKCILEKYGCSNGLVQQRIRLYALIKTIIEETTEGKKKIAIKCGGVHTCWLINDFFKKINIDCIIDNNIAKIHSSIKKKYRVISSYTSDIDLVIISTYEFRIEVRKELESQGCRNYIDIYEELENRGICLSKEYYHFYDNPYKYLIELRNEYYNATGDKSCSLIKLIQASLDVRDFVTAFEYIDEYINERYQNFEKMNLLRHELKTFLQSVREECIRRDTEDIIWFWQDGLQTYIVDKMPFYQKMVQEGMNFENSFTPSAVTRSVYARVLDGIEEYDVYKKPDEWPVTHKTIQWLIEKGYRCFKVTRLDEEEQDLLDFDYHNDLRMIISNAAATEVYWGAIRILLKDDTKKCLLVHTGLETHVPIMAPNLREYKNLGVDGLLERFDDKKRNAYLKRLSTTVQYVDKQWQFYYELLNKKCIKIYMSDHGDLLFKESHEFTKDLCQNILTIVGNKIPIKQYKDLFSITDFFKVLKYVLEPNKNEEESMFVPMIRMTGVDAYNKAYIEELIDIDFAKFGLAFDGYMTLSDRYIVLGTGEEIYNVFPDDYINRINDLKYQDRIQWFRDKLKQTGLHFIDINTNKKFKDSHLIYEALGKERMV